MTDLWHPRRFFAAFTAAQQKRSAPEGGHSSADWTDWFGKCMQSVAEADGLYCKSHQHPTDRGEWMQIDHVFVENNDYADFPIVAVEHENGGLGSKDGDLPARWERDDLPCQPRSVENGCMPRLLTLLRGAGAGLALALAFLPAVLLGSSGVVAPARDAPPVSAVGDSDWGGVERVLRQQASADDDDVPGWVWGVGGGAAGAAIVAALGYKFWLGRRR